MHMSIGEYITSSKVGGQKGKASTKRKALQSRISFAAGSKSGYLTDAELAHWSEQFALPDHDSKAIEKAVDKCLGRNSPLSSIAKLKSKDTASSRIPSLSVTNTSLNSSTSQGKYSLSLDRWVHWQTAPLPHKIVGHSTVTNHLKSTMEFMDVLNAGDNMGLSYELEMQSFLDPDDIKICGGLRKRSLVECSEEQEVGSGKNSHKKRRIFEDDDSSEDEDFKSAIVTKSTDASRNSPREMSQVEPPQSGKSDHEEGGKEEEHSMAGTELSTLETPPVKCRDVRAPSQHVVPRAPSPTSLDWIDFIQPSQVSTPKYSSRHNDTPPVTKTRDFEFVTPKVPPSSSRKRQVRTPSASLSPPSRYHSSMDLFGDIPSSELFADFSDAGIDLGECKQQKSPIGKPENVQDNEMQSSRLPMAIERSRDCPTTSRNLVSASRNPVSASKIEVELDMDVTVIEESDIEGEGEVISSPPKPSDNHSEIPSPPDNQPTDNLCAAISSDDSFIQMHGKRLRKRAEFLQSPPFSAKRQTISPGSKENAGSLLNRRNDHATISPGSKASSPEEGNVTAKPPKRKPAITELDSSDDEFEAPLHTRLKRKKGVVLPHRESKSATTSHKNKPKMKDKSVRIFSTRERQGYVEEEAELSDDDFGSADETELDCNVYDFEDSFINDASMLTQLSPTQPPPRPKGNEGFKSPANMGDVYRRSLMSPDTLFAGKRRGCGNQYRMVFSQRHKLLNHYINKAGFRVTSKRSQRKKLVSPESGPSESEAQDDRILFDTPTTDNYSEAEEVYVPYGEEELEELATSQSFDDLLGGEEEEDLVGGGEGEEDLEMSDLHGAPSRKRRAVLFSDSDMDASFGGPQEEKEVPSGKSNYRKKLRLGNSASPEITAAACSSGETEDNQVVVEPLVDGVISPCLLADIAVRTTPSCYCLGLDDLLSDGEEEGGGGESPLQVEKSPLDKDIDMSLTQKEIEMNFDLETDCFSDTDIMADSPGYSVASDGRTKYSAPVSFSGSARQLVQETLTSSDKPSNAVSDPAMTDAGQPSSCPLPSNNSPVTSVRSSPLQHGNTSMGTILASSREIAYSQASLYLF